MSLDNHGKPRVGIPWRTSQEEKQDKRQKIKDYEDAVLRAGGDPLLLPLHHPEELQRLLPTLDAFVLPGSPGDVDPVHYGSLNKGKSEKPDANREATDFAVLRHAFSERKPVLAICYGCQSLNVYLGGTLIQDLRTETGTATPHTKNDQDPKPPDDPQHGATLEPGSRLAALAGAARVEINSSHHQAIDAPGRNLRIAARAADGVIEGVEWTGDANWVIGVQWHPERMQDNRFAERLFADFVAAARGALAYKT